MIEKNLNIIEEVKTLAEVDDDRETNFGLEFLIKSL